MERLIIFANKNSMIRYLCPVFFAFLFFACGGQQNSGKDRSSTSRESATSNQESVFIPTFNSDSAYQFIAQQVNFGPRVPNTSSHVACGNWLEEKLREWSDTVYVQRAKVNAYDGTVLNIRNLIGSFRPEATNRLLFCAHWDTRPWADHDPDPANHFTPIDGANDGGSGVGVLLEIARLLHMHAPETGVDIIFFDAEDYGEHRTHQGYEQHSWALGSQYWSQRPHRTDYFARYGVLLDMVGAYNATFKKEGYSMLYAPNIVRNVWKLAQRKNFGHYFINQEGGFITDDHLYVNEIRGIPTINIIDLRSDTPHGFFPQWHTMGDTMEQIDPATLDAVGNVVLSLIYEP